MMNWIFSGLIVFSAVSAVFSGRAEAVSAAAISSAGDAVSLMLALLGAMAMWCGFMKVADQAGLTRLFAGACRPLLRRLFKGVPPGSEAEGAISMNLAANLLGLGNAATPLGLRAMAELRKLSPRHGQASADMTVFVVLNTASVQLIPTTVSTLRQRYGAANPLDILPATLLCSLACAGIAVGLAVFLSRRKPAARRVSGPHTASAGEGMLL